MKEVLLVLGFVLGIFEFQAMSAELQNPAEQRLNPASSLNKMNPDLDKKPFVQQRQKRLFYNPYNPHHYLYIQRGGFGGYGHGGGGGGYPHGGGHGKFNYPQRGHGRFGHHDGHNGGHHHGHRHSYHQG